MIERDRKEGREAKHQQVFRIDVRDATEVSRVETLPTDELPTGTRPVLFHAFAVDSDDLASSPR